MLLFAGGAASVGKIDPSKPLEEFVKNAKSSPEAAEAYEMMLESAVKDVASLLPSVQPCEIVLSGRFVKVPEFLADLKGRLAAFFKQTGLNVDVRVLGGAAKVGKQAAEGAAVFANGLAGGKYKPLIDAMRLRESEGTVFSNLYLGDAVAKGLSQFKKL